MRRVIARPAVRAVILPDRAPLPLARIRPPQIPVAGPPQPVLQPPEPSHPVPFGAHHSHLRLVAQPSRGSHEPYDSPAAGDLSPPARHFHLGGNHGRAGHRSGEARKEGPSERVLISGPLFRRTFGTRPGTSVTVAASGGWSTLCRGRLLRWRARRRALWLRFGVRTRRVDHHQPIHDGTDPAALHLERGRTAALRDSAAACQGQPERLRCRDQVAGRPLGWTSPVRPLLRWLRCVHAQPRADQGTGRGHARARAVLRRLTRRLPGVRADLGLYLRILLRRAITPRGVTTPLDQPHAVLPAACRSARSGPGRRAAGRRSG